MKTFMSVLLLAAVAAAQPTYYYQPYTYEREYKELLSMYENSAQEMNALVKPEANTGYHEINRLNQHLRKTFEHMLEDAVSVTCKNMECHGTKEEKLGLAHMCLHSDEQVHEKMNHFEHTLSCTEGNLTELTNHYSLADKSMEALRDNMHSLEAEYIDESNRETLGLVIEFHSEVMNDEYTKFMKNLEAVKNLTANLVNSAVTCSGGGFPRISKEFFKVDSVLTCMEKSFAERHHNMQRVPESEVVEPESQPEALSHPEATAEPNSEEEPEEVRESTKKSDISYSTTSATF